MKQVSHSLVHPIHDFDLVSVNLHHQCNVDQIEGCQCCRPKQTRLCCDLHNPDAFAHIQVPVIKSNQKAPCSSIPAHQVNETDAALCHDLEDWRCMEMEKLYGKSHLQNLGPGLVMGTMVRNCIVDCAHFSKIQSVVDLEKETKWGSSTEFGPAIIKIIGRYYCALAARPSFISGLVPSLPQSQYLSMQSQNGIIAAIKPPR